MIRATSVCFILLHTEKILFRFGDNTKSIIVRAHFITEYMQQWNPIIQTHLVHNLATNMQVSCVQRCPEYRCLLMLLSRLFHKSTSRLPGVFDDAGRAAWSRHCTSSCFVLSSSTSNCLALLRQLSSAPLKLCARSRVKSNADMCSGFCRRIAMA